MSYDLLRSMTRELCKTGRPFIVESNFTVLSVLLSTGGCALCGVLFARFRDRAQSCIRHPGHQDLENLLEFEATLTGLN